MSAHILNSFSTEFTVFRQRRGPEKETENPAKLPGLQRRRRRSWRHV